MLVNRAPFRCGPLLAIAVVAAMSCGGDSTSPSGATPAVFVRVPADSLFMGRSMKLLAVATGDSAAVAWPAFAWSSSDTTIAVVDSTGVVLGLSPGRAVIRADFSGHRDSMTVRVVLQRVDNGVAFMSLSSGHGQNCALTAAGTAYCRSTVTGDSVDKYTMVPGADGVALASLSTALNHKCGTRASGQLYCWGNNNAGQFMTGGRVPPTATIAPAAGGGSMRFSAIAVGTVNSTGYTCGVNQADSVVYCAGQNQFLQLGHPTSAAADSVPTPVTGNFRAIALTASQPFGTITCAIATTHLAYCWGSNNQGAGGVGTGAAPRLISTSVALASISGARIMSAAFPPIASHFVGAQIARDNWESAQPITPRIQCHWW